MQCACSIFSYVACPGLQYFSTLSPKGNDFKKRIQNARFLFSRQLLSEIFFTLKRTERHMVKNVYCSSCKLPIILVRF